VSASKLELGVGTEPYPGYRLTRFLGRGGWGEVWHARAPDGSGVALKFLASDSPRGTLQEIRALQGIRQLRHPNLIRMDNIWSCAGWLVIVMELADGSLADLLDVYGTEINSPIPPDHLCFFLGQAAAAIDFLNARQHDCDGQRVAYRHADVKPSNLLLVGSQVRLSDFSLAVQATSPVRHSFRGGTVAYAAPEMFHGSLSDRSDLYSLAATYYHLRTGKLPFPDGPKDFSKGYTRPAAPDLSMMTDSERPILTRAFAPTPTDRWSTCTDFIGRLRAVFGAQAVGAA